MLSRSVGRSVGNLAVSGRFRWYSAVGNNNNNNNKTPIREKITEESDFAFRKNQIQQLSFNEQDKLYYPPIGKCENILREGMSNVKKLRVEEYRQIFNGKKDIEGREGDENPVKYLLSGKISSIRKAGKGSMFIDIIQDLTKLQLIVHHKVMNIEKDEFIKIHSILRPGDQIMCIGKFGITKVGELSLKVEKPIILASPSLHPIPPKFNDLGKINKNRVIDYLVNKESVEILILRSKIIKLIRNYLEDKGFNSFETPIICNGNSGANAKPFETYSQHIKDDNNKDDSDKLFKLNLRVAPELWLKRLIISGFDKIYEIGKSFRNEGIDSTHNPEFTTCEFYQTFIGLNELMEISEEMFKYILLGILNDNKLGRFHDKCLQLKNKIDENDGKFGKIEFLNEIKNQTGYELTIKHLQDKDMLIKYFQKIGLSYNENDTIGNMINKLIEEYLEPITNKSDNKFLPTFIYNIPEIISPLSKSDENGIGLRFEMFINGIEYMNAYEEENNPFKQKFKFQIQQNNKEMGDEESLIPDYKYLENMEWSLPPTGGWGMGIDRIVMLISDSKKIEKVLPFGRLNDVIVQ